MKRSTTPWLAPGVLAAAALLAACAPIPKLADPARTLTPAQAGLQASHAAELRADWWTEFKDPQLDALIERALAESPSLAGARARIAKARALTEAFEANERPQLGAGVDVTRERLSGKGIYPAPLGGNWWTLANAQLNVSYEWDFFGRNKAELAAAIGARQAALAEGAAARLMLSSQVARSYLALARALAQRELLQQQLAEREDALALVRQRVQAGLDNEQDLRGAETPLPELRRQRVALDEQAALLRHQLAALTVQPGEALDGLAPRLPAELALRPNAAQVGLDLLGRRPDVVAARWRVEAATQQVTAARAQFYPNISLNAFAGFNSLGLDHLANAGARQLGFGPSLRLPIFDTGRLGANLRGSAADADAAVAAYNAALLEAVRDARDQLVSVGSLQRQQLEQRAALDNAQASLGLAESRFQAGLGSRLAVLSARGNLLAQQRQDLDLRGQTLEYQVNLVRSLGGGWNEAATATAATTATNAQQ
ncbi:MAG: efflux transporter outer membrane subunit [Burkholderiaceae bacterium]